MKSFNILFLCTGNSARSILAEALVTTLSQGKFIGYSAGSQPSGNINPIAETLAIEMGYPKENLRSKSWDEFSKMDAPRMDFIITVCDNAAKESCPIWIGHPATAHWGFPDPGSLEGTDSEKKLAFLKVMEMIKRDIALLINIPMESLSNEEIKNKIQAIHSHG